MSTCRPERRPRGRVRRHGGRRDLAQAIAQQIREATATVAARHPGQVYLSLNEVMKEIWRPEGLASSSAEPPEEDAG